MKKRKKRLIKPEAVRVKRPEEKLFIYLALMMIFFFTIRFYLQRETLEEVMKNGGYDTPIKGIVIDEHHKSGLKIRYFCDFKEYTEWYSESSRLRKEYHVGDTIQLLVSSYENTYFEVLE